MHDNEREPQENEEGLIARAEAAQEDFTPEEVQETKRLTSERN